jgi:hypothetical protein
MVQFFAIVCAHILSCNLRCGQIWSDQIRLDQHGRTGWRDVKVSVMRQGTGTEGICMPLSPAHMGRSLTYRFGFSTNRPMGPSPQTYPLNPMRCECYCHLGWGGRKICDEPTSNLPVTDLHSSIHHEPSCRQFSVSKFQMESVWVGWECGLVAGCSGIESLTASVRPIPCHVNKI